MTAALENRRLTETEARSLTEEVKADAAALWAKLLALYDGEAHVTLGYSSWGAYYEAEFGQTGTRGYQLLEAARVVAIQPGLNERQAREMVPVLREAPGQVEEVWGEVVEEHGPTPTAAEVREVVEAHIEPGPRKAQQTTRIVSGIVEKALRINELAPHLDLDVLTALPTEEKEEWVQQLRSARTVLSRVIAAL